MMMTVRVKQLLSILLGSLETVEALSMRLKHAMVVTELVGTGKMEGPYDKATGQQR